MFFLPGQSSCDRCCTAGRFLRSGPRAEAAPPAAPGCVASAPRANYLQDSVIKNAIEPPQERTTVLAAKPAKFPRRDQEDVLRNVGRICIRSTIPGEFDLPLMRSIGSHHAISRFRAELLPSFARIKSRL